MVWKQDLAKLKATIRDTGAPPPPLPKPKAKPVEVKELHDEDAFFLAAMGAPAAPPRLPMAPRPLPQPAVPSSEVVFETEMGDLKGMKPLARNPVLSPMKAAPPAPLSVPIEPEVPEVAKQATAPSPVSEPIEPEGPHPHGPQRIQLAAGMAVEVDAALDLRHHSPADAVGRLRDRVEDGALLGWRTLHVQLGEDEPLRAAFLAFLESGGAARINRFAQAPIPMGGTQAWILYY
ncbi:MAG: hypothetical protein JST24_09820 [Acidobacteria bacterium]|nr:hypothetical protein [Acidobacteriota bacterium]